MSPVPSSPPAPRGGPASVWLSGLLHGAGRVRRELLHRVTAGRGVRWSINGRTFRVDPRYRTRMGPIYDPDVAAYVETRARPTDLCLNVGANLGVYTLQFLAWSAPGGRVVAFEPNPAARRVLERHVRYNGLADRVTVEPLAVGGEPARAELWTAGVDGMGRLSEPNPLLATRRVRPVEVEVVTLDEYCRGHRLEPSWILMDVEGFELAALEGASDLVRSRPGLRLVVEMHPDGWRLTGHEPRTARALLDDLGLTAVPLSGQADGLADHGIVALERRP